MTQLLLFTEASAERAAPRVDSPSCPTHPIGAEPSTVVRAATNDPATTPSLVVEIRARLGEDARVVFTNNSRIMVSARRRDGAHRVRLHHMFVTAPPHVVRAVVRYLQRGDRFASAVIDEFIASRQHLISRPESREISLRARGEVYDLEEVLATLAARYFEPAFDAAITWGRCAPMRRARRGRRSIRMGTYSFDDKLIRIHPALDQVFVPRFFVEWVVYHEMLHAVVPAHEVSGRRRYHTAEFRTREAHYHDIDRAREWERQHLRRLLISPRPNARVASARTRASETGA